MLNSLGEEMSETFPGERLQSPYEINRSNAIRTVTSASIGLTGLVLHKTSIALSHIDEILIVGGGVGTLGYGFKYTTNRLFQALQSVDAVPRREFGIIQEEQRNAHRDIIEQSGFREPPSTS